MTSTLHDGIKLRPGDRDDRLLEMPAMVGELLQRVGVDATEVVAEELSHNRWLSPGVWRVRTRSGQLAVLKYTKSDRGPGGTPWEAHWTARDHDPRRWTYWRREALAYQHDLAAACDGSGIMAPACLGVDVDASEAVLLLAWVEAEPGEAWPVKSYGPAAEALGRAQAPFLLGEPLPLLSWLSRRFLREYSSEKPVAWGLLNDSDAWAHPAVRETFPGALREGVQFVHEHRERLYQISESLPRTLCHLDFWPKNLFRRSTGEIVVIDWSFAGDGAIGEAQWARQAIELAGRLGLKPGRAWSRVRAVWVARADASRRSAQP